MNETPSPSAPSRPILAATWAELKRRKVVRAAIAYAVVAWIVLQVAEVVYEPLGMPAWAMTWTVLIAILGLPVALVLTWFFDATTHGIEREARATTGAMRLFVVGVVLLTVAGFGFWLTRVYEPAAMEKEAAAAKAATDAFAPPANSIAVLPFEDMSEGGDQAYLGNGIAEELLDRLARIDGLRVAARTSSFAFRERADDVKAIGRALDVAYVLEGSVRKAGGQIRVTAQLISAKDGFHVFSETYERSDKDLFALQDDVTTAIVEQLKSRIGNLDASAAADTSAAAAGAAPDAETQTLYLEARERWRRRTPADLAAAQKLFEQAIERDRMFARAHSGLADTYLLQADYGVMTSEEAVQRAEEPAVTAVTLDPKSAEAWATLGLLRLTAGQVGSAIRSFEQSMELDPRYEMAPMWLAAALGLQGRWDEEREVLKKAHALNPLEPVVNSNYAQLLSQAGQHDEAIAIVERALAITPDNGVLLRSLADVHAARGDLASAVRVARRAVEAEPDTPNNRIQLVNLLVTLEDFAEARTVMATLPRDAESTMILRQKLSFASGERAIDADLERECERIRATGRTPSPDQRGVLTLGGLSRLRAGDARGATEWLSAAMGDGEVLDSEPDSMDAASLLIVALRQLGQDEEAQRWRTRIDAAAARWLAKEGGGRPFAFGRALYAAELGDAPKTVAALENAYKAGFRDRWSLLYDPRLAALANDPAFKAFEQRLANELAAQRAKLAQ